MNISRRRSLRGLALAASLATAGLVVPAVTAAPAYAAQTCVSPTYPDSHHFKIQCVGPNPTSKGYATALCTKVNGSQRSVQGPTITIGTSLTWVNVACTSTEEISNGQGHIIP